MKSISSDSSHKITISHAHTASAGKGLWNEATSTIENFIKTCLTHKEGKKDGACFTQGSVADRRRMAKSVIKNDILGFDLDSGETAEEIDERLAKFGLAYVRYTTFSHLTKLTEIKRDAFFKWSESAYTEKPPLKEVKRYLIEKKGLQKRILKKLEIVDYNRASGEGALIVVRHKKIPKHRVIFFLNKPFVFQGKGAKATQTELVNEWKERYHGFGTALGFTYDQSCTDPSRLFYWPRHASGAIHDSKFVPGKAVNLKDFDRLSMSKRSSAQLDDRKRYRLGKKNLVSWAKHKAPLFEIEEALRANADEDIFRKERSKGPGVHIECPFEDEHTKAGGVGAYVVNASENDEFAEGFTINCLHDSCASRDRLDHLKGMIENEWLPKEILDDEEFYLELEDEAPKTKNKTKNKKQNSKKEVDIDEEEGIYYKAYYDDPELISKLKKYNKEFAYVIMGQQVRIMLDQGKKEFPTFMARDAWNSYKSNEAFVVPSGDDKVVYAKIPKLWSDWPERSTYRGVVFEPGVKLKTKYNLFDGFHVKPNKKASWELLDMHIFNILCNGNQEYYDWFITWMAQIVQQPGKKLGSCAVFMGEKGTGKSITLGYFAKCLGKYAIEITQGSQITGNFNAHQQGALLLVCEEAVWAGAKDAEGALKSLITSDEMMLEQKGIDVVKSKNYCRVSIISNEDWVVPASMPGEERRFFIQRVSSERKQDIDYFNAIVQQMEDENGIEAMMHTLMTWKPPFKEGWNILRTPPITDALKEQAIESLSHVDRFFMDMVRDGGIAQADYDYKVEVALNEEELTRIPFSVLRYHFEGQMSKSVQSTSRSKANSSKALEDGIKKYLCADEPQLLDFKETEFREHVSMPPNFCTKGYDIPPLSKIRKQIKKKFALDV